MKLSEGGKKRREKAKKLKRAQHGEQNEAAADVCVI